MVCDYVRFDWAKAVSPTFAITRFLPVSTGLRSEIVSWWTCFWWRFGGLFEDSACFSRSTLPSRGLKPDGYLEFRCRHLRGRLYALCEFFGFCSYQEGVSNVCLSGENEYHTENLHPSSRRKLCFIFAKSFKLPNCGLWDYAMESHRPIPSIHRTCKKCKNAVSQAHSQVIDS